MISSIFFKPWNLFLRVLMLEECMELAIPLIALGGLYVVSNQKKKEGFETVSRQSLQCPESIHGQIF